MLFRSRNHAALTPLGRLNLRKAAYAEDGRPIDGDCSCYTCRTFSRAYLRHLAGAGEMLAATLLSIHNLAAMMTMARDLRLAILDGRTQAFVAGFRGSFLKHRPLEV